MLTIRTDQLSAFDGHVLQRFADDMADDLFRSMPDAVAGLSWSQASRRCLKALLEGRGSGLSDRADLYGFVLLSFLMGTDFHQNDEIRAIFSGPGVAHGRKITVVIEAMLQVQKRRGDADVRSR